MPCDSVFGTMLKDWLVGWGNHEVSVPHEYTVCIVAVFLIFHAEPTQVDAALILESE